MPEYVPAGVTTNAGQPIVVNGKPAIEYERVPSGIAPDTTAAILIAGTPAKE